MKYLKLFEEMNLKRNEFPFQGHDLSPREKKVLIGLVEFGESYIRKFAIKVEDHYYYVLKNNLYNVFDGFNMLKDYVLSSYYLDYEKPEDFLELLKTSKLDPSFDDNRAIKWACKGGHVEILKHLLSDSRVDPCVSTSYSNQNELLLIASYHGHKEVIKLLLNHPKVRSKLSDSQINRYNNETY